MRPSVYWYHNLARERHPTLTSNIFTDNLVIGGGIAGLSCAQRLLELGQQVTLLEAGFVGAGATGRSSGFITPDSELGVSQLRRRFGDDAARDLWQGAKDACGLIRDNIQSSGRECGLIDADSFYCARGHPTSHGPRSLEEEFHAQCDLGFAPQWIAQSTMPTCLGTTRYSCAIHTTGTFAMQGAQYAQALANSLVQRGFALYEHSPVTHIAPGFVRTGSAEVRARRVFVCTDRFAPTLGIERRSVYRARTYLALTRPLPPELLHCLFPAGPLLVWDTDLVYQYFRTTPDHRLLVGGSLLTHSTSARRVNPAAGLRHLTRFIESTFPQLAPVDFEAYWPGLIGVSKDVLPIAGPIRDMPDVYAVLCGAGLPWSTLAARTTADLALNHAAPLATYFDPARAFGPADALQPLLGKPATWGLAYYYAREHQRGGHARAEAERTFAAVGVGLGLAALTYLTARTLKKRVAPPPPPRGTLSAWRTHGLSSLRSR
jgi:gamma-glutamylputrescine oxidase